MIALKRGLPLIRNTRGTAIAFASTWLRIAIHDAAGRAGYHSWWLVDDLVAGISLYLRDCYVKNVIDLPELERLVRDALRTIGYEEVAACFRTVPPTQNFSLAQCLKAQPSFSRSAFFNELADAIKRLSGTGVRHFHFYDLHACVDHFENKTGTGRLVGQERLRERIVSFVRESVRSQGWSHQMWCSIT